MGFLNLFVKKKVPKSSSKEVPLSKVEELVSKGLSKRQIVDFLKSEGYSIDLIEKAFSQLNANHFQERFTSLRNVPNRITCKKT